MSSGSIANIRVEPVQVCFDGVDLGFTDGDVELTLEEQLVDVTAHQSGTQVVDAIRTGSNIQIALSLKETSVDQLNSILSFAGSTSTAAAEVSTVTTIANVASSADGQAILLAAANDSTLFYAWGNVAAGGNDPLIAGRTAIPVTLTTDDTADEVATAYASAIDGVGDFSAVAVGSVVTITNAATGPSTDLTDVDTTYAVCVITQGMSAGKTGWGESKRFTNVSDQTKILKLHPVRLAASDFSKDLVFWRAYPVVDSITKSGENPELVSVNFRVFPDQARDAGVNLFALGEDAK